MQIKLMEQEGPGTQMISFCMTSCLAALVLDDDVMAEANRRKEATTMFVATIALLERAVAHLQSLAPLVPVENSLEVGAG